MLSMMMCIQNLISFCKFVLKTFGKNQNLTSIKGRKPVANLKKKKKKKNQKQWFISPMLILSMIMNIQNLISFCQFDLKILSKNKIMT